LSDENVKLVAEAKAKLSEAELRALARVAYDKGLEDATTWVCEDMDRLPVEWRQNRRVLAAYFRIIWSIFSKPDREVSEDESEHIRELQKNIGFSNEELAVIFTRSKATIYHHLKL